MILFCTPSCSCKSNKKRKEKKRKRKINNDLAVLPSHDMDDKEWVPTPSNSRYTGWDWEEEGIYKVRPKIEL